MKDKKMLLGISLAFLVLATIGISYAYFNNAIVNKDVTNQVVSTGTLELTYTDGPEIKMVNIKPGSTFTKKVTIKNTGTLDVNYNLMWTSLSNEITNGEMVISASCKRLNDGGSEEGTCNSITESSIGPKFIESNISIEAGITHEYNITIMFKDINAAQDYNQGKSFGGVLGIKEYVSSFEEDPWSLVISNVKSGNTSNYKIGDTKEINLGSYGTHTVRLSNNTTPDECATDGFSQTACGYVFEFADVFGTFKMNTTNSNTGGWPGSSLYTTLNGDIFNAFPTELKNNIIDTTVVSSHGKNDTDNFVTNDKLYFLSPKELYSDWTSTYDSAIDLTRQLDYYSSLGTSTTVKDGVIKYRGSETAIWWTRTSRSSSSSSVYYIGSAGASNASAVTNAVGISPAFRLG